MAGLFGLGLPELAVIGGVVAVLFGPSKLPELGRSLGKTVKSFQTAAKARAGAAGGCGGRRRRGDVRACARPALACSRSLPASPPLSHTRLQEFETELKVATKEGEEAAPPAPPPPSDKSS